MISPKQQNNQQQLSKFTPLNILNSKKQENDDQTNQNPQQIDKKLQKVDKKLKDKQLKLQKVYLSNNIIKNNDNKTSENKFKMKFKQIITSRQNNIKTLSPRNLQNSSQTFRITKGIKFNKAKRYFSEIHYKQNDPSPDQYKYQNYQKNRNSPKFSFGKQDKFFKTRKQLKCKTQIPGPGNYRSFSQNHNIKLTIPHSDRFQQLSSRHNPGVGQYQIQKPYFKHSISIKFPQQRRKSLQNNLSGPGPNKYYIQQKIMRSTNQSFNRQKRLSNNDNNIPGVGQYSIARFKQKNSPSARFPSTGLKDSRYKKQQPSQPGPAQYRICPVEKYKQRSKITSVIFAKAKKQKNQKQLIPGPGNYNISEKRIKIKGGILTGRSKYQHKEIVPGPGNYEPNIDPLSPKTKITKIGKQVRLKRIKQVSPGPNDYQPQKAKIHFNSTGFVFPKSSRQFF